MKYFYKLLDFYIESSLHVAFAVYALIRITFLKLNLAYDEPVAYFGFYGTIVGYNFIKYDELVRVRRVALSKRFKAIIGLSFICFWITLYYFWQLETITKLLGIGALFLTVLYTIPFIPNKSNMRNWSGIKIFLVAVAWVAVTVWLPVINAHYPIDILVVLKSLQRFILVFVLMLIFEIVDLQFDDLYLKTIPQQLGEKKTKFLAYILLVVFILLDLLKPEFTLKVFLINLVFSIILGLFTYYASKKRNKYYTSFWVESLPVFWLVLLLIS
ncbi:UbiA prenyltransferase family protein [Flavobacterium haoranii]|uniref:Prenyltransferase n=1 Tax=Flavobacterium haoranii TaxID=683124 RepID=A0A1M6JAT8_9FLAO|nr:hypothetical protein [Flavobacterium haoranii]SHJ43809.1 hypothetical protein SAMN05444337_2025 [Flavobacterium haoranii]